MSQPFQGNQYFTNVQNASSLSVQNLNVDNLEASNLLSNNITATTVDTTNVDTIFKTELLNITKSEIFNKTMGRLLFKEFFGLTAYLSLGSMCNLVEWLNQTILTN